MSRSICDLPLDIMVHIINLIGCEESIRTINICDHFQKAVCHSIRFELIHLRRRLTTEISSCQKRFNNLSLSDESLRMDIVKLLMFLRFLLTEIEILFALIWRFSSYNDIWSQLCPFLVPVVKEYYWNIEQQINLQVGHLDLSIYNIRHVFPKWHEFLSIFDNGLGERLNSLLPVPVDFEIIAVDILTRCPSINFQIALDFVKGYNITNNNYDIFNIYSFFKLNHLKTSCQIPNVHNVELSNKKKQYQLVKFLREIVQWENLIHLRNAADDISNLELRLILVLDDPRRANLIKQIQDSYVNIQSFPYEPIFKSTKIIYINDERHWNEYYCRFSSYNESLTGVRCIIDVKNKKLENLPLIHSTLRGDIKNTLHNIVSTNDMITFNDIELNTKVVCNSSNESSIFQLVILYRERLNSSPGQAIVNVCYDENKACQVTLNMIESEPFT